MKIDILTLFPNMFKGPFDESIVKRAQHKKLVEINIHNLRKWTTDKYKTVDDKPFGGGTGMVLKVELIYEALKKLKSQITSAKLQTNSKSKIQNSKKAPVTSHQSPVTILLSPQGKPFNQKTAQRLSKLSHLILVCGHYEGFDERIRENLIDEEISIGNYILTGGEIPSMVLVDSITRLIPGVLKKPEAVQSESFSPITSHQSPVTTLEYPQYTRPANFKGWKVPEILLSGDHKKIEEWRKKKALEKTKKNRPDLLKGV